MQNSLSDYLSSLDVDNVFVYVADAVRWDALPDSIATNGLTTKGVASSIHSPTSFASLVSGTYPPSNGVFSFSHRVTVPTLFDIDGVETYYESTMLEGAGADDSLFSVFGLHPDTHHGGISKATEPFVVLERGNGGHAPYGESELTAWEYFRQYSDSSTEKLRIEYERRISEDTERFFDRLGTIEERNLSQNTLVIYTADHGELLGEGGLLGHNSPMLPELVYVPMVFIHPDLPNGKSVENIVRHVDILPTILSLIGDDEPWPAELDGHSVVTDTPPEYGLSFYDSEFFTERVPGLSGKLTYEGGWDYDGGHVFTKSPLRDRMAVLSGKLLKSAMRDFLRRHLIEAVRSYLEANKTYGTPTIDRKTVQKALETANKNPADRTQRELSSETEDQLHDLGYL